MQKTNQKFVAKCAVVVACLCAAMPARALETRLGDNAARSDAASTASSLTAYLQMTAPQIERLNRFYDDYADRRLTQETKMAQWQQQLQQAQAPTSFDERRATRLLRDIGEAQQKVVADFLSTRAKALKTLTPVQRAQLETLTTDSRMEVRRDRYYQILLLPVENMWQAAPETERRLSSNQNQNRQPRRYKGNGSYGVYGGYGYGQPQYGVYGSYGEGPIGVHAGIGRGGPSIGIGIGRVFGGGWLR